MTRAIADAVREAHDVLARYTSVAGVVEDKPSTRLARALINLHAEWMALRMIVGSIDTEVIPAETVAHLRKLSLLPEGKGEDH